MKQRRSTEKLWYNAKLDRVTSTDYDGVSGGLILGFSLLGTRQVLDWLVETVGDHGDLHSLATVAHYLDCPYKRGQDFDPRKMIGKLCCIKVQSVTENGKKRLEIVRMLFHMGALMHAENGQLVGFIPL